MVQLCTKISQLVAKNSVRLSRVGKICGLSVFCKKLVFFRSDFCYWDQKSNCKKGVSSASMSFFFMIFWASKKQLFSCWLKKAHFERLNHEGLSYESVLGSNLEAG